MHDDLPAATEAELLQRIRAGDESAFAVIFRLYFPALVAYVYRFVLSDDIAEDIAQSVLLYLWEQPAQADIPRDLTAYLRALARRRAIDLQRHERVVAETGHRLQRDDPLPAMGAARLPDQVLELADMSHAIDVAFATLPPRTRAVAIMRWQDGLSRVEIAESLGVSPRTVNAQLVAAAKVIRRLLEMYRE